MVPAGARNQTAVYKLHPVLTWLQNDEKVFWIHSNPGSGKSILVGSILAMMPLVYYSRGERSVGPRMVHFGAREYLTTAEYFETAQEN